MLKPESQQTRSVPRICFNFRVLVAASLFGVFCSLWGIATGSWPLSTLIFGQRTKQPKAYLSQVGNCRTAFNIAGHELLVKLERLTLQECVRYCAGDERCIAFDRRDAEPGGKSTCWFMSPTFTSYKGDGMHGAHCYTEQHFVWGSYDREDVVLADPEPLPFWWSKPASSWSDFVPRFGTCVPRAMGKERQLLLALTEHSLQECAARCKEHKGCDAVERLDGAPDVKLGCLLLSGGTYSGNGQFGSLCFLAPGTLDDAPESEPFNLSSKAVVAQQVEAGRFNSTPPVIIFISHHKTGTFLARGLGDHLSYVLRSYQQHHILNDAVGCRPGPRSAPDAPPDYNCQNTLLQRADAQPPSIFSVSEPVVPRGLARSAAVYFIRHPVDIILSAYRYHCEKQEAWTKWQTNCELCAADDWQHVFSDCFYRCSYSDLLLARKPEVGIRLEFAHMKYIINTMLQNMQAWQAYPGVLFVSFSQFEADFRKAVLCVSRFLRLSPQQANNFEHYAEQDNVKRLGGSNRHVTSSRHDNSFLRRSLSLSGLFGSQLDQLYQLHRDTLARGIREFGCPAERK